MTLGSAHSPYPPAEPSRFAGICSGPADPLLLVTLAGDELDVAEVVAVGGGTVAGLVMPLLLIGVAALCGAGGGLSSYRPPFIIDHHVTPVEVPAPVAGEDPGGCTWSYRVGAAHATGSAMVRMIVAARGSQHRRGAERASEARCVGAYQSGGRRHAGMMLAHKTRTQESRRWSL